ncbi:hypothetical protein THAR02_03598 [Trichoderma harzianum]|uniref:Uncharacterized protein n=1 Tax=Trichoderma harzianum TaxID=5544 RepID=A0A0F9XH25_TRIHA|nr:hypothetical protein THAR02_03598 [Trichoderma harzianum]
MAYAENHNTAAVQALIACANIPSIGSLKVPDVDVFDMSAGHVFNDPYIRSIALEHAALERLSEQPVFSSRETRR